MSYSYYANGNLRCKSDVVGHACTNTSTDYAYGQSGAFPHAVTGAGGTSYSYDADGNMSMRGGGAIAWNSDNLPTCIDTVNGSCTTSSAYSKFSYAPDKHRYMQVAKGSGTTTTTYYIGGLEIVSTSTGVTFHHNLSAYGRLVYTATTYTDSSGNPAFDKNMVLTDHLGSVDTVVTNVATPVVTPQSFDAFGKRRSAQDWYSSVTSGSGPTRRGFTDHEHLDNLALIHMNGRVYDPAIARFMSVDPIFQAPTNSQSVNPYSYVMNNPLSLTDPSGYEAAPAAAPPDASNADPKTGAPSPAAQTAHTKTNCGEGGTSACKPSTTKHVGTHIGGDDSSTFAKSVNVTNGGSEKQQGTQTATLAGKDAQSGGQAAASTQAAGSTGEQQPSTSIGATGSDQSHDGGKGIMGFIPFVLGEIMCGCRDATKDTGEALNSTSLPGEGALLGGFKGAIFIGAVGKGLLETAIKDAAENIAEQSGKDVAPLLGRNAKISDIRANTDLPGGSAVAKSIFKNQAKGQSIVTSEMANGGVRRATSSGVQIRFNPDGSVRLDLPNRGPVGKETIHFDPPP